MGHQPPARLRSQRFCGTVYNVFRSVNFNLLNPLIVLLITVCTAATRGDESGGWDEIGSDCVRQFLFATRRAEIMSTLLQWEAIVCEESENHVS